MEDRTMPSAVPVTAPDGGTWVKIDTISVSTLNNRNSATGISSSVTLQNGVSYLAVAHETGRIATDSTGFADAEFIRYNKDTGPQDGSSPGYTWVNHGVRLAGLDGGETAGNLWGGYQPDHQYVKNFIGRGAKVTGYYTDIPGVYGDNSGSITVDLYASLKPTVNLISSAPVAVYGQPVTLTATVAVNSTAFRAPPGTVTFFDGDTVLGVGTLTGGTANVTVKLNAGDHAIRAVYSGSGAWPSASASLSQTVDPATLLVVTHDKTKTYGDDLPELTWSATGFVNNDSPGLITGALATDATPDSDPGDYLILQGTLDAGPNYAIDFYPGTLTVRSYNIAPDITAPDILNTDVDTPIGINIGVNDPDAGKLPVEVSWQVSNGTLSLTNTAGLTFASGDGTDDSEGTVTGKLVDLNAAFNNAIFKPTLGFKGVTEVSVSANDLGNTGAGGPLQSVTEFRVTVGGPFANADDYSTLHDTPINIAAVEGVLANDDIATGSDFQPVVFSGPSHGTVIMSIDGSFTYTPFNGYVGVDRFRYSLSNGFADTEPVEVRIDIANQAPTVDGADYSIHFNTMLAGDDISVGAMTDEDQDSTSAILVSGPSHADSFTLHDDGTFIYVPSNGYVGEDSFVVKATDGLSSGESATVTIQVTNNSPIVSNENYALLVPAADSIGGNVLSNDSDPDADPLTVKLADGDSDPPGQFDWIGDGSFTFKPNEGFVGEWSFKYLVADGGGEVEGTATIKMLSSGMLNDDYYIADKKEPLTVSAPDENLLANDILPINQPCRPVLDEGIPSTAGTLTLGDLREDGTFDETFQFKPAPTFTGETGFYYKLYLPDLGWLRAHVRLLDLMDHMALHSVKYLNGVANKIYIARDTTGKSYVTDNEANLGDPEYVMEDGEARPDPGRKYPVGYIAGSSSKMITNTILKVDSTAGDWLKEAKKAMPAMRDPSKQFVLTGNIESTRISIGQMVMPENQPQVVWVEVNGVNYLKFIKMTSAAGGAGTVANLGDKIAYDAHFRIEWGIKTKSFSNSPKIMGTSDNPLYVTLKRPLGTPYHTLIDLSCRGANGLRTNDSTRIPAAVFKLFETRDVARAEDGGALSYWRKWAGPFNRTTQSLLMDGDGMCGAWSRFFLDCLKMQGLSYPIKGEANQGGALIDVRASVNGEFLMIKSWDLPKIKNVYRVSGSVFSGSYAYRNFAAQVTDVLPDTMKSFKDLRYVWAKAPEKPQVIDNTPPAAQNNKNSKAIFPDHMLVYIGGTLYDPSYGVSYNGTLVKSVKEFEIESVQLYGFLQLENNTLSYYFRPIDNVKSGLIFSRMAY